MSERKLRKLLKNAFPLETERLNIRCITLDDAYDMYEYTSISSVSEFLIRGPHLNLCETEGCIEAINKQYLRGNYSDLAIELKNTNKMIGTCGFSFISTSENYCELGYVLSPLYRKKGYMTEAVKAFVRLSFEILGFKKIVLRIINENIESKSLAEKLGFILEEIKYSGMVIKEQPRDIAIYVMNREIYEKKEAE